MAYTARLSAQRAGGAGRWEWGGWLGAAYGDGDGELAELLTYLEPESRSQENLINFFAGLHERERAILPEATGPCTGRCNRLD